MNKKLISWMLWLLLFFGLLALVSIVSFGIGVVKLSPQAIISSLFREEGDITHNILFDIRLPRIVLGLAVGGGLSLVGVLLQGMFRNPLVEPYTLGISGGACLGVCLNIVLRGQRLLGLLSLPLAGFLGALAVLLFLYVLSTKKGALKIKGILLSGVMISYISSSLIMLIMALSQTADLHGIILWTMGSLDEPSWGLIKLAAIISGAGLIISYLFCFDLNAFSLGEEEAAHLGVNVERTKKALFIISSLLTGAFVAVAGIIGFVGLVVPHFMRLVVGQDHRILIIASYLVGAAFLIFCDTFARMVVAPLELPVGVITGILGGTLFLFVLARRYNEL